MEFHHRQVSRQEVAERVDDRVKRQGVLRRDNNPLELHSIIDESVLYRRVGTRATMVGQLRHLVDVSTLPAVRLQVVPLEAGVLHATWFGPFTLFTSAGGEAPFMFCTEHLGGMNYQDGPGVIDQHLKLFEHLVARAMSPAQSAELIHEKAENYPT
jgi:hypothetical protein